MNEKTLEAVALAHRLKQKYGAEWVQYELDYIKYLDNAEDWARMDDAIERYKAA